MKKTSGLKKQFLAAVLLIVLSTLLGAKTTYAQSATSIGAGAAGGAAVGAAVGSVVPGVGTAVGAGAGAVIGGVGAAVLPSAAGNFLGDLAFTVVGKAVFFFMYILSFIAGLGIAVEAWLIGAILNINAGLVNSAPVKAGFPVTLAVANLGFVLAIIVIALATIIRYEAYGMKKILMKLVAAAILVNFSLVIAGVILNFSDQLSGYILKGVDPDTEGFASYNAFASRIAGAFNPQRGFLSINPLNANPDPEAVQGFASSFGGSVGKLLTPLTSLVFVVFALLAIIITLFALIVMLVVRYVFLGILLILMPLVWLLWIFPNFKSHWDKWWNHFLRWAFFPPLVLFFLWVALKASDEMNKAGGGSYNLKQYTSASNSIWGSISSFVTSLFSPIVENLLQMTILVGLMIGGIFAANSLGITFASTAMGAVNKVGKGFGNIAKRRGMQLGGAALDKTRIRSAAQKLQETNIGKTGGRFRRLFTAPVGYGARMLGRGVEDLSFTTREGLVKDAEKRMSGYSSDQFAHGMDTFTAPERIYALRKLRQDGDLEKVPNLDRYLNEDTFKNYGRGSDLTNMNRAWASDSAMRAAAIAGKHQDLYEAAEKYIPKLKSADISQGHNWDEVFNDQDYGGLTGDRRATGGSIGTKMSFNIAQIRLMAETNQSLLSPIIRNLKGNTIGHFESMFKDAIMGLPDEAELLKKFQTMIYYNSFSGVASPPTPTATTGGTTTP